MQAVEDSDPSWVLAVYSLTSFQTFPAYHSGCIYIRALVWIKNTLLKQISHYPHLRCFGSHHKSVLETMSQIPVRQNWSGKFASGAYLTVLHHKEFCKTRFELAQSRITLKSEQHGHWTFSNSCFIVQIHSYQSTKAADTHIVIQTYQVILLLFTSFTYI